MISMKCHSCGSPMKAPETYEGRWGRCRKCGASVLIAASYSTTVACPECNKQFPVEYQGELDLKSIVPCDRVYFLPFISGMGTLAMMVYTYMNITRGIAEMKSQMNRELAGNPFRGIADAAMQSVQMQWGWAVLLIGAFLLLICSGMRSEERVQ